MSRQEERTVETADQTLVIGAWAAMLLASNLASIVWRELLGGLPYWWPWFHAAGLAALLGLTFIKQALKSLRLFVFIMFTLNLFGFAGDLEWGIIPYIRASSHWLSWTDQAPWALSSIALHLFRLTPALVVVAFLLLTGLRRKDFFLVKGKINAPVEPSKLLGMKKPESWTRIGSIFAVVFTVITLIFLMLAWKPSPDLFAKALPLIPVAILIAGINAFNEEFTLRAAPLSTLTVVGRQQALVITTVFFGLGHFYGVPNGVPGVLLSSFLGWFLGKSLLETKGFFWAWLLHFLPDVLIFTFYVALA
jgi:hypothetical protein